MPEFRVYSGSRVREVVNGDRAAVVAAVESAYKAHHAQRTVNPDSYFLRFPEHDADRIIALPAHYTEDSGERVTGIKWISSFPGNIDRGLARASAVLVLNDETTGYPVACMEAAAISASRTAAGAVLALRELDGGKGGRRTVSVIGTGVISEHVLDYLGQSGVEPERILLHDAHLPHAERLAQRLRGRFAAPVAVCGSIEEAITAGQVVVFATTAGEPHVHDPRLFAHNPVVLHLSLRDLAPEVVLAAHNVVDDVDHALKARTSLHLAELLTGGREFVRHTLPAILSGAPAPERDRPVVFSPFGMGILDLAVGNLVHSVLADTTVPVEDFFQGAERC
ncbi:2,3-diaminopropionate biosynthesis protein SbnB [Kitasatospora phosalacinea]|uniref:2,3-diaminopropionate biosynthesis protein SbnB n=1 Tax=Kitasatospora phosalacinea TaxID=2065 RepID=UPI001F2FB469|nr:2,3-diaminopropionate biosynthesis protein SbnB [Kitasatospora phosalacinea]